jgi:hypothetical protein
MPYKTRPYIPYFALLSNPFREIEVTDKEVRTFRTFFKWREDQPKVTNDLSESKSVQVSVKFPVAPASKDHGILTRAFINATKNAASYVAAGLRSAFDLGNVTLSTKNGTTEFMRVNNATSFARALRGEHPDVIADTQQRAAAEKEKHKFDNVTEADMANIVIYYPHIPKAVNTVLQALDPENYFPSAYKNILKEGTWVRKGDVIARYGRTSITCPFDGRLEMVGNPNPGLNEWPEPQEARHVTGENSTTFEYRLRELNRGHLVYSQDLPERDCFAFAIRPLKEDNFYSHGFTDNLEGSTSFGVRYAFDNGTVFYNEQSVNFFDDVLTKRLKTYALYSIIDMVVYDLKEPGNGIKLPDSIKDDQNLRDELMRYWGLINTGMAPVKYVGPDLSDKPAQTAQPNLEP